MQPTTIARRRKAHVVNAHELLAECEAPGEVILPEPDFEHLSYGWLGCRWEEARELNEAQIAGQIDRELKALGIDHRSTVHMPGRIVLRLTSEYRLDLARAVAMRWAFWHCHGAGLSADPNVSITIRHSRTGADLGHLPSYRP